MISNGVFVFFLCFLTPCRVRWPRTPSFSITAVFQDPREHFVPQFAKSKSTALASDTRSLSDMRVPHLGDLNFSPRLGNRCPLVLISRYVRSRSRLGSIMTWVSRARFSKDFSGFLRLQSPFQLPRALSFGRVKQEQVLFVVILEEKHARIHGFLKATQHYQDDVGENAAVQTMSPLHTPMTATCAEQDSAI